MKEQEFLKLAYAAYGSNLHLKQMEVRCPTAECIGKGYLEDYQLVFGKRGFLDVVPCPGQKVQVCLFKVTDTDLQALDEYEEYPELYDSLDYEDFRKLCLKCIENNYDEDTLECLNYATRLYNKEQKDNIDLMKDYVNALDNKDSTKDFVKNFVDNRNKEKDNFERDDFER